MPVRKQNRDTSRSLATFLETAVRQDTGDESFIPVERLYEQFIASGMDYAGALSSGYSEGGLSLTVTAGIDWGKLIAPFGPFTLESTASGAGQRARRTLLVIQRQPQSPSPSDSFWCGQPICVMNLAGVHWQFKTKLNLTAEVGLPDSVKSALSAAAEIGPEEVALSLDASVSAEAGVSYDVSHLFCQDIQPKSYTSGRDAGLITYFDELVGEKEKGELKKAAAELLKTVGLQPAKSRGLFGTYMTDDLLVLLATIPAHSPQAPASQFYKKKLRQIQLQDKNRIKTDALAWLEQQAPTALTDPTVLPKLKTRWGTATTEGLILALQVAQKRGLKLPEKDDGGGKKDYIVLLNEIKEKTSPTTPTSLTDNLCFLRLWGHGGGGEVQVAAALKANIVVREKEKGGTLQASAGAGGSMKFTSYRYQTWSPNQVGPAPLVMTQDTTLTYREARLAAAGEVAIGSKKLLSKEGTLPYHMLTYRSAVAFWYATDRAGTVICSQGSGLCYGVSVQYSRLCRKLQNPKTSETYIQVLAAQLRVPPATLIEFINQAWFLDPTNPIILPNDTIILESAWAVSPGYTITLTQPAREPAPKAEELLKKMQLPRLVTNTTASPFTLQSICGRYRLADMATGGKTLFKLGFPDMDLPVKLGIQLQKVTEAGTNAVVDIDTWWVDTARRALSTTDPAEAYEGAVPHVALFHQ